MRNLMLAVLMLVAAFVLMGATCQSKQAKQAGQNFLKCEQAAALAAVPGIIPVVGAVVASGGTNPAIDASLIGLAIKFGIDTVDCALAAIAEAWQKPPAAATATQPDLALKARVSLLHANDVQRAQALKLVNGWLKTRGQQIRTVGP